MAKPLEPTARVRHTIAVVVFLVIATPSRKHASRPKPKLRENKINISHVSYLNYEMFNHSS
jgi:hypothetical protein